MTTASQSPDDLKRKALEFAPMFHAFLECSPEIQGMIAEMSDIIADTESSDDEREIAADAIAEALAPALMADVVGQYSQFIKKSADDEATAQVRNEERQFAENVRRLMDEKGWNQETLADKIGVSQPVVSNMLSRHCRPQNRTILRLAEAFGVSADTVWPDFSLRQSS